MKKALLMIVLTLHLFSGKDYYLQVISKTDKGKREIISISIYGNFTKARQVELKKYINRTNAITTENKIFWKKK